MDNNNEKLFTEGRTFNNFQDKPVSDEILKKAYDLAKMGPTSANSLPMRILFLRSQEEKEKLKPALDKGNQDKTMKAPVVAIIAYDMEFYENMPKLFPQTDAKSWFVGKPDYIKYTATQSGTLSAGYFVLAARMVGLDCGPMNGFNNEKTDEIFFEGTSWKSNFLINLGYGDTSTLYPRNPRLDFSEACKIV